MMKKWLVLTICACLLTGCTRYNPIDMTDSALENASPSEPGSADTTDGTGADDGAGTSDSDEAEEPVLQITDDDRTNRREPVKVKGIYVSAYVAGNETMMDNIIKEIDATELNAVVIDFKNDDGRITAPIDSELFNEIGACKAYIPDMKALTDKLKEHDIYAIARIVAFKDPYLAEKKPEWSLKKADGSIYRDKKGLAWVNPYRQEVWDYLVEAGTQAAEAGFDEIQFDYIRFATDSTMRQVVFDEEETKGRSKTDIIAEFTQYAYDSLTPLGVFVSADVFGAIIGSEEDAGAVGQIYGEMAQSLDYICPMIYPSHYGDGNFGLDHPDLHPYETILGALQKSEEELSAYPEEERQAVVRPWLQDFTATYLKHHIKYGNDEIREQIQAVYDAGYEEWILWNASNNYHYGGLEQ
ncbi:hypothetical protein HMPREF9475_02269 [[Clostridium] symbiosum WAL-14673]|nr:hypothetical protein HMPREF9475_02269 [[Clostridium] symbiosum WAL-14673]